MKSFLFSLLGLSFASVVVAEVSTAPHRATFQVKVIDESGDPLYGVSVVSNPSNRGGTTNINGVYTFRHRPHSGSSVTVSYLGYSPQVKDVEGESVSFTLSHEATQLEEVEVFGYRHKQPDKLDYLTRMPLRVSEQIQSISVISNQMIEQQGTLTLSDATKNVVGVSTFATYGGASESLMARGYRGLPILKNGVRVHSDFRGQGSLFDMQGVESIQVVKGSAAITQGIGNDLGSAGGTVNIATKTPTFTNEASASLRVGSWGLVRPTFDVQGALTKKQDIAFRLNGALERSDNYRIHVSKDRIYLNPSLAWKINDRSTLVVELDYLHDSRTPDRGTVNLAVDSVNALFAMPHDRFLGFETDRIFTDQLTYSARFDHKLNDHLSLRFAYAGSQLDVDNTGASTQKLYKNKAFNQLVRSIGRSQRADRNQTVQIDLVGKDLFTGKIKHTFQVGMDFRYSHAATTSFKSQVIDTIDVLQPFSNVLPGSITMAASDPSLSTSYSYGILAQDVITFNRYLKAVLGARYSLGNSLSNSTSGAIQGDAFNPLVGLIVTPYKDLHLFGSFTTTTDLRSAANLRTDGTPIGASTTQQFETGFKSEWLQRRLRFNLTLFHAMNRNLAYSVYDEAGQATGRYDQAGDLQRCGIEVEVTGRILPNLQMIVGYAYLDARYRNSPAYIEGSSPLNVPKHTGNGWIYYDLDRSVLKGLSFGLGAYYVGDRPVNDWTQKVTHQNTTVGMKPFDLPAYTTLHASIGYKRAGWSIDLVANNLTNSNGYSSYYRGGYINPIDPLNVSGTLKYCF